MRAVIQRVREASVTVDDAVTGSIGSGFLILLGVTGSDSVAQVETLAKKTVALRIFRDNEDKMNLSLVEVGGSALVVSQFTLYADTAKGNRPSFVNAAPPEQANNLYQAFCRALEERGIPVQTGVFGAKMEVRLLNDGPVTICLDTDAWNIR